MLICFCKARFKSAWMQETPVNQSGPDLRHGRDSLSFSGFTVSRLPYCADDLRCRELRIIYPMRSSCINDCVCMDNIVTGRAHAKRLFVCSRKEDLRGVRIKQRPGQKSPSIPRISNEYSQF